MYEGNGKDMYLYKDMTKYVPFSRNNLLIDQ